MILLQLAGCAVLIGLVVGLSAITFAMDDEWRQYDRERRRA